MFFAATGTDMIMATLGGIIIGLSTSIHLKLKGRITGMSGILFGLTTLEQNQFHSRASIVLSMMITSSIIFQITDFEDQIFDKPSVLINNLNVGGFIIGGILIGFGTKLGNGCTSGHGVCGIPRFSLRSIVAVCTFMATGIIIATLRSFYPFLNSTQWVDEVNNISYRTTTVVILVVSIISQLALLFKHFDDYQKKTDILTSILVGFLFSLGLIISGMAKRSRVIAFLTFDDNFNPALAFVMAGAIAFNLPSFYFTLNSQKPMLAEKFEIPQNKVIDLQLIIGAACFGLGWGIAGICPGPLYVIFPFLIPQIVAIFFPSIVAGQQLASFMVKQYFTEIPKVSTQ